MKKNFRSFEEARKLIRSLELKNDQEWKEYSKSGKKPDDIPASPNKTYKNKGWISLGDWIGTGRVADQLKQYLPFPEARKYVRNLKLKGQKDWRIYCKSGNKPDDIPANPNTAYKDEYKGFQDWLGSGNIANRDRKYKPFGESRKLIHSLQLRGTQDWRKFCK